MNDGLIGSGSPDSQINNMNNPESSLMRAHEESSPVVPHNHDNKQRLLPSNNSYSSQKSSGSLRCGDFTHKRSRNRGSSVEQEEPPQFDDDEEISLFFAQSRSSMSGTMQTTQEMRTEIDVQRSAEFEEGARAQQEEGIRQQIYPQKLWQFKPVADVSRKQSPS